MAIEVGQEAPDFTLVNEANEPVHLAELRGTPVVLVFFSFAFSGICTAENCEIRDNYSGWQANGAKVFGISRDSRFVQAKFKEQEHFTHSLLADVKGDVAKAYGVFNENVGVAERATIVIDRDGKVVFTMHNGIPDRRDFSSVEEYLK
jgi:peroxiredoxin